MCIERECTSTSVYGAMEKVHVGTRRGGHGKVVMTLMRPKQKILLGCLQRIYCIHVFSQLYFWDEIALKH